MTSATVTTTRPYQDNLAHLDDELHRLDLLIQLHAATFPDSDTDIAEVRAALSKMNAEIADRVNHGLAAGVPLALPTLSQLFGLSAFETQAIIICLAPELHQKYDRLYAYLQDDLTLRRPTVDLVLQLLCDTEHERWNAHRQFADTAPLLRGGLLTKVDSPQGSRLAQSLRLDARIHQYLLGGEHPDARIAEHTRFFLPAGEPEPTTDRADGVFGLVEHHLAASGGRKLVLYLSGPEGVGRRRLAGQTCHRLGVPLLTLDTQTLLASTPDPEAAIRLTFREALFRQAAVHLLGADVLLREARPGVRTALAMAIAEYGWLVFLSGTQPWADGTPFAGADFESVDLPIPDTESRAEAWRRNLTGRTSDARAWAAQLAGQFRLTPGRIAEAIRSADNRRLMAPGSPALSLADVTAACQRQSSRRLGELALRIEPQCGWDDIVLPADHVAHLRELCDQVRLRHRVFSGWGFDAKLNRGAGLGVLFSGPPGTGKTMAAEVIAREVGLDLYKVDLAGVVSKYIGETEKNLARVFTEAEAGNAILFFDEADALFGKRTEVSDAHDRYANIETSYLLQRIEEYDGVVIMATNLRDNMDEAFTRRIRFVVEFPFPDVVSRQQIWRTQFPALSPLSPTVDFGHLAGRFAVTGGSIKNIALNAAFLAAANGNVIELAHVLHAARREFEKLGKLWTEPGESGR